jgi:hypothetical protein
MDWKARGRRGLWINLSSSPTVEGLRKTAIVPVGVPAVI